jgi:hypothetical protein
VALRSTPSYAGAPCVARSSSGRASSEESMGGGGGGGVGRGGTGMVAYCWHLAAKLKPRLR